MDETLVFDQYRSTKSLVTDASLRKLNRISCVLHFGQGGMMLVASQVVPNIKAFSKNVTTSFLAYDVSTRALVSKSRNVGSIEIGVVAALFLLLSAFAHLYVLVNWNSYIADINRQINRVRWYEYAASSSLMICGIAMLFGCYDLGSLILMFFINACMNFFGLLMEILNPENREKVVWLPFWFGCWAGVAPWVIVLLYFLGGGNYSQIPGFVYGIVVGYFIFFNTFPVNMYLQYAKVGRWRDYRHGERVYILLSLLSKSLLAWLVFGGTAQPNGQN